MCEERRARIQASGSHIPVLRSSVKRTLSIRRDHGGPVGNAAVGWSRFREYELGRESEMNQQMTARWWQVLLAALCLVIVMPGSAVAAGPYEPNDTAGQAWGPLHGSVDYNAAIETIVDQDYYVFYSPGVQQVILTASTTAPGRPGYFDQGIGMQISGPGINLGYPNYGLCPFEENGWCLGVNNGDLNPSGTGGVMQAYIPLQRGTYYLRLWDLDNASGEDPTLGLGTYTFRLVPSTGFVTADCIEAQFLITGAVKTQQWAHHLVQKDQAAVSNDQRQIQWSRRHLRHWRPAVKRWSRYLSLDRKALASARRVAAAADQKVAAIRQRIAVGCNAY
jgi:hypothetical protein